MKHHKFPKENYLNVLDKLRKSSLHRRACDNGLRESSCIHNKNVSRWWTKR